MRISCDNCGATYRIPEHKLVREVNKATCRKCGHAIIIKKGDEVAGGPAPADHVADRERTQITSQAELQARAIAKSQNQTPPPASRPSAGAGLPTEISPRAATAPQPRVMNAPRAPAAAPQPRGVPMSAARTHDPAGDLSIVMMACFAAAFGALVLATSQSDAQTFIGLFIALWSAVTSLFVLVTGNRGRKEASVVMSLVLGLLIAGVFAGGLHYLRADSTEAVAETNEPAEAAPVTPPPVEEAAVADEAAEEEAAEEDAEAAAEEEVEEEAEAVAEADPPPETRTTPPPANNTPPANNNTAATTRQNTRTEPPAPKPETTKPAAPTSSGVPLTVLDTMIKSNRSVKTCFALYREETGSLPSGRITVTLTVDPSGAVTGAGIGSGPYDNTSLDSCLGGAISKIRFPAFEGSAKTYRYPFIL